MSIQPDSARHLDTLCVAELVQNDEEHRRGGPGVSVPRGSGSEPATGLHGCTEESARYVVLGRQYATTENYYKPGAVTVDQNREVDVVVAGADN